MSQTEVQLIKDAVIVNADVSGSAAIDVSKISGALPAAGGTITGDVTFDGETAGRDIVFDRSDNSLEFADNAKARFGNGADLEIYHGGTNSIIQNTIGDLYQKNTNNLFIQVNDTEAAIYARPNAAVELYYDGSKKFETTSGGVTVTGKIFADSLDMGDDERVLLGTSDDLQVYHDGSNSYVKAVSAGTGDLYLFADGKTIYLRPKSGEDGIKVIPDGAVELYHNNGKKFETTSGGVSVTGNLECDGIRMIDSAEIRLGTGDDLTIESDGTNGLIKNHVGGSIYIRANANVQLMTNASDGGADNAVTCVNNGAVELYHDGSKKFETTAAGGQFTGTEIKGPDNCKFVAGTSGDADFYHDGSATYLRNATGNLHIRSDSTIELQPYSGDEVYAKFINDGAVELYYDNSKKFETTSNGATVSGRLDTQGLFTGDNYKILAGNSDDLEIYHNGSHSIAKNGTGDFYLAGDSVKLVNAAINEDMLVAQANGAVKLYYDNSQKLETISTGIKTAEVVNMIHGSNGVNFRKVHEQGVGNTATTTATVPDCVGGGTVTVTVMHNGNFSICTTKMFPIMMQGSGTANLGSEIFSINANSAASFSVSAATAGVTVTNNAGAHAKVRITFDITANA